MGNSEGRQQYRAKVEVILNAGYHIATQNNNRFPSAQRFREVLDGCFQEHYTEQETSFFIATVYCNALRRDRCQGEADLLIPRMLMMGEAAFASGEISKERLKTFMAAVKVEVSPSESRQERHIEPEPRAASNTVSPTTRFFSDEKWYISVAPIIIGMLAGKLIGLLGVLMALGVYYGTKPKFGMFGAAFLAVTLGGVTGVIISMNTFQADLPTTETSFQFDPSITNTYSAIPVPPQPIELKPTGQSSQRNVGYETVQPQAVATPELTIAQPTLRDPYKLSKAEVQAEAEFRAIQAQLTKDMQEVKERAAQDYPYLYTAQGEVAMQKILARRNWLIAQGTYPAIAMTRAVNEVGPAYDPRNVAPPKPPAIPVVDSSFDPGGHSGFDPKCRWITPTEWSCK